jgi:hypothetical protein
MPDPIDRLALAVAPYVFGTAQAPRPGRLRPLLVGRPHPRRRLGRWGRDRILSRNLSPLPLPIPEKSIGATGFEPAT